MISTDQPAAGREPTDDRRAAAVELGHALAESVADPEAVTAVAERGLRHLARAADRAELLRVAPELDGFVGVAFSTVERAGRIFARQTRRDSPMNTLLAVERLFNLPILEARWLAMPILERLVVIDPERTWQLLRRASREARDWITVDALAHPVGRGVLAEAFRWSELGQLVFAPSSWERRLVGSTIATLPFVDRDLGRDPVVANRGLELIATLIGDDRPEVQKALAWALRSLTLVDPHAVRSFLDREAVSAAAAADGHRAWVVREALVKLDPAFAAHVRGQLAGVRRRSGSPSTSAAAATASAFVEAGGSPPLGGPHRERIPVAAR
ncbi:MAG TPA: DNA alkylation repair protein [Candidatus Limnocylindrales bacterium]|nr:DNA alkylation repair protein [Candidatus Limnocylindrales bacterium]